MRASLYSVSVHHLSRKKKRKNTTICIEIWFQMIWLTCFLLSYSAQCKQRLAPVFKIEGQVTHIVCHTSLPPTEPIYDQCPALTSFLGLSCISFACFMSETELSNIKSGSRIHSSNSQYNKFTFLVGLSCSEEKSWGTLVSNPTISILNVSVVFSSKAFGTTNVQFSYKGG